MVVTALAGGASVNVSNSPAYDGWPMWTPNGRWLLFASNRDKLARTGQIYAVRPDGSGLRAVTTGTFSRVQPSVSADGKRLLVNENVGTADTEFGHIANFPLDLPD